MKEKETPASQFLSNFQKQLLSTFLCFAEQISHFRLSENFKLAHKDESQKNH